MKRTIAILLSLTMIFCLSACGNSACGNSACGNFAEQPDDAASENPPAVQTQPAENKADDDTQKGTGTTQDAEEKDTAGTTTQTGQDTGSLFLCHKYDQRRGGAYGGRLKCRPL